MKSKLYSIRNLNIDGLMAELEQFFRLQGHQVQVLPIGGASVLQAQKESTFSAITGQSSALTIKVVPDNNGVQVEIGSTKWIDKAAVGLVGYVILPVLAIIPMIGMYNQYKLGEDAWRIIDSYVSRAVQSQGGASSRSHTSGNSTNSNRCHNCQAWLSPHAAFCSGCGAATAQTSSSQCKKCGFTNQAGARFCSSCGGRFDG